MILKRAWAGKDGNIVRPSLVNAMEGLSPFAMLDLDEDEVASLNNKEDLIQSASLVSVKDLRALRARLKICVPTDASEFLLILKRFANLLHALFSADCPLFRCVQQVINAIWAYSRESRRRMTIQTKASILWITLLQARQFAMGEANVLCEFSTMHSDLCAKRANIHHGEIPQDLLNSCSGL